MLIRHEPSGNVGVLLEWVTSADDASWAMVRCREGVIKEWEIKDCRIMTEGEEKNDLSLEALDDVWWEIIAAEKAWPGWPKDVVHGAAIVGEEAGELLQAALKYTYEVGEDVGRKNMRKEALHTAATVVRFLKNLDMMEGRACMDEGKGEGGDAEN